MNVKQKKRVQDEVKFFVTTNGFLPNSINDFDVGTFFPYEREYAKKLLRELKKASKKSNPTKDDAMILEKIDNLTDDLSMAVSKVLRAHSFVKNGEYWKAHHLLDSIAGYLRLRGIPTQVEDLLRELEKKDFPDDYRY